MTTQQQWQSARARLQGRLSGDQVRLVDLLAEGKRQAEIAELLGMHRSAVWRRVREIRKLDAGLAQAQGT